MMILFVIIGIIFLAAFITFVIGMTRRDIHIVRLEREYRRHPYARQFRERPLVSVIIDGEPTDACLQSFRKSDYNKIQIVGNGQMIDGDLILTCAPDTQLERTTISRAVRELNNDPTLGLVELLPGLSRPQTTRQLFGAYRTIAAAPFASSRAGLRVALPHSFTPRLIRPDVYKMTPWKKIYLVGRWFVQCAAIVTLAYSVYLTLVIYRSEFLLMYLAAFGLWLIWSIVRYRHFTFSQKLSYLLLAPASIISFMYLTALAPLRIMQYAALLPTRPRGGIIAVIDM